MSFQTGLSGLNASSRNLDVIGNNIANANTIGMKSSRAEFGDLVASSLGAAGGSSQAGIGVAVAAVAQQFTQGNISTTGNSLDVAINGGGFFQLTQPDGTTAYTRDGEFKLDKNGYVLTNTGANVMGFPTDRSGNATSVSVQKLQLPTSAPIPASATATITAEFNLDARAPIAATATGVTASLTTPIIANLDFTNTTNYPPVDTTSVASGAFAAPASTTATDAFQFKIDGALASDRLVGAATATNLDTDIAAFVAASGGAYSQTGTVAGGNLSLVKADGTPLVTATAFSNAVGSATAAVGLTSGGTFANAAFVGTTANTNPVGRTFTAVGPGGTAMTITLDQAYANINAVLADITGSPGYASSGITATVSGSQLVFTATNTNTAGNIVFGGGSNPDFLTTGSTPVTGIPRTAAVPTPRSTYGTSLTAYDSQGAELPISLYFSKVTPATAGTDEWAVYDSPTGATVGSLVFDANGKLQTNTVGTLTLTPASPSIVPPFPVTVDFSKVTQYGAAFAVSNLTQDGYPPGELTGLSIGENGVITTRYANGQTQSSGKISLADFRNIQGLQPLGGNAWAATFASGLPVQGQPSVGKFGSLRAGALEDSNVDLTSELVNMMTAQRAYQANAQTIKTQDQIMSTLVNLR